MSVNEEIFDIAPEFETEDSGALLKIDRFIVRAQRFVAREVAGAEYDYLVALKTAELMTLAKPGSQAAGAEVVVLEEKSDNASWKYANPEALRLARAADFAKQFEDRMAELCIGGFVTSNGCD